MYYDEDDTLQRNVDRAFGNRSYIRGVESYLNVNMDTDYDAIDEVTRINKLQGEVRRELQKQRGYERDW